MKDDVWTVELMHAISIYETWESGPWRMTFGQLNFECTTCLMKESVLKGTHIVTTVATVFPYLCFGKKSKAGRTLNGVRMCCWDVRTNAPWNSLKLLDIEEGPDGKFSSSERMMLWQSSIRTEYHVVQTDAKDPIFLSWNLCKIF
jgi:hypothetical protein